MLRRHVEYAVNLEWDRVYQLKLSTTGSICDILSYVMIYST
ncbi:hypothetical protein [Vibrio gallaecicus]|nr:hypothetical protein [Vibrio gallaecicus]MDN3612886.1 hypothetical protein [Vibrio gallaecicus]